MPFDRARQDCHAARWASASFEEGSPSEREFKKVRSPCDANCNRNASLPPPERSPPSPTWPIEKGDPAACCRHRRLPSNSHLNLSLSHRFKISSGVTNAEPTRRYPAIDASHEETTAAAFFSSAVAAAMYRDTEESVSIGLRNTSNRRPPLVRSSPAGKAFPSDELHDNDKDDEAPANSRIVVRNEKNAPLSTMKITQHSSSSSWPDAFPPSSLWPLPPTPTAEPTPTDFVR